MKKLIAVCISLAGIFAAAPAAACSILAPQPHQITQEPPPDDVPPPEQPEVSVKSIERGTGPDRGLFVSSSTSCDDLGFLELKVTSSRDDVGYVFEVVDGSPPGDLFFPEDPTRTEEDSTWFTAWSDGAENNQESFQFTLTATAIDRWGRESEPSEPVVVSHPGTGACGGGSGSNQTALVVFGLLLSGLMRRRV